MLVRLALIKRTIYLTIRNKMSFWNSFLEVPHFCDTNTGIDYYCEEPSEVHKWLKDKYSYINKLESPEADNMWEVEVSDEELLTHSDAFIREQAVERLEGKEC